MLTVNITPGWCQSTLPVDRRGLRRAAARDVDLINIHDAYGQLQSANTQHKFTRPIHTSRVYGPYRRVHCSRQGHREFPFGKLKIPPPLLHKIPGDPITSYRPPTGSQSTLNEAFDRGMEKDRERLPSKNRITNKSINQFNGRLPEKGKAAHQCWLPTVGKLR